MDEMWECTSCHSLNRRSSAHCYSCGATQSVPAPEPVVMSAEQVVLSPAPVSQVTPPAVSGVPVEAPVPQAPWQPYASATYPAALITPVPIFCTRCGTAAAPEATFCGKCGAPLPAAAVSAAGPMPEPGYPPMMAGYVPAAAPAARHKSRAVVIVGAIIVIAALALGGGFVFLRAEGYPKHQVAVTFAFTMDVTGFYGFENALPGKCEGNGGYSDLSAGASVILKDESDRTIAATSLGWGTSDSTVCTFKFTLSDVPDNATFYNIEVSHRGTVSFSHADMVKSGWTIGLSIGS
jgi:hypothetical protein